MLEQVKNVMELTGVKVKVNETKTSTRFRTPDGLIFKSREEYLDYVNGLKG